MNPPDQENLKLRTARTLKWNSIDRFSTQILYAVVGVVLANLLSKSDFGLVGVLFIFQAFAILFVDSGFGAALLQKKEPDQNDYSTVFWFNLYVSIAIYILLWFAAPFLADLFHNQELTFLSRIMFLSFVITGLAIVQTNRLMKQMNVKMIALSNIVALIVSGIIAVWLALSGKGAWAIVWQSVSMASVKCIWLWVTGKWIPSPVFKRRSFQDILRVGTGVFGSSLLNTVCLNIYPFIIGIYHSMSSLGVYTQADKWSKMGFSSLTQIFTSTFIPVLSGYQDDKEKYAAMTGKINRLAAFMTFPFLGGLIAMGTPIFHLLFGNKWDDAILLFQILCARGILLVFISLYSNFLLGLGRARTLVFVEAVKDILLIAAIFATIGFGTLTALVWGQFAAAALTYIITLLITSKECGRPATYMIRDILPYMLLTAAICLLISFATTFDLHPALTLIIQAAIGISVYYLTLKAAGSSILREAMNYAFGRFRRNRVE